MGRYCVEDDAHLRDRTLTKVSISPSGVVTASLRATRTSYDARDHTAPETANTIFHSEDRRIVQTVVSKSFGKTEPVLGGSSTSKIQDSYRSRGLSNLHVSNASESRTKRAQGATVCTCRYSYRH